MMRTVKLYPNADPAWLAYWQSLTEHQRCAVRDVLAAFDEDPHKVCEAMGMEWDGNMGWNT
jgi:hypothetical protein